MIQSRKTIGMQKETVASKKEGHCLVCRVVEIQVDNARMQDSTLSGINSTNYHVDRYLSRDINLHSFFLNSLNHLVDMASASITTPSIRGPIPYKSQFLGKNHIKLLPQRSDSSTFSKSITCKPTVSAKFDLFQILGGRGLCNGEVGILEELKKDPQTPKQTSAGNEEGPPNDIEKESSKLGAISEDAFGKEMLGLTGGFPGGEKGLQKFLEKNPPPPPKKGEDDQVKSVQGSAKKSKPPELPLLLPGMIAIVKNPKNPFYMYCGIVQRITDGKAGVIFEGGNWDRLVTFRLEELERREKGPPMVNPKSAVLEPMIEMLKKQSTN